MMLMYETFDDKDNTSSITSKLPFDMNENPSKIMCFLIVDNEEDIYALVQSCDNSDHNNDSVSSSNIGQRKPNAEPILHVIPVDSFGHQIMVIEDDASIVEQFVTADLKVGVTVVTPHAKYWPNQFLS